MTRLTLQEKLLWFQLGGIAVTVAFYAHFLLGSNRGHHYVHAFFLGLLLLFASFRFFLRRRSSTVVQDERDRSIAALGARWSNVILWLGLVLILVLYWDHGTFRSSSDRLIGVLFHLLVLAGSVRVLRELVAYRTAA